ncbi:MAG TPA: methyltransferase domain-containing protein [Candidatus Aquilonibacter sp.]|nr:methyltransferase domain-containing protein [Candidatus Aquilonibacter sp.]
MKDQLVYTVDEFEIEARYIDTLIWEALAIEPQSKVLLCGYGPEGAYAKRALASGADVTVIEHRQSVINDYSRLGTKLLRGSTSVIPAKDNSYDLAIAFHYLHEIDPFFHAQVLAELARVARRVAVVEPAPPADPLGKRIALLYSQAKRELGQFEYYQPLEYWKKLLQSVKADVSQHVFAFAKVPPREYLYDTVELMLRTIEIEDAPPQYLDELRQIAKRSDASMLPPPRYVLVGAAAGELVLPTFTQRPTTSITAKPSKAIAAAKTRSEISEEGGYAFPPVDVPVTPPETITAPAPAAAAPAPPPAPQPAPPAPAPTPGPAPGPTGFGPSTDTPAPGFGVPGLPFGTPTPPVPAAEPPPAASPFGVPFAVPEAENPAAFGWQWEPPEGGSDEEPAP